MEKRFNIPLDKDHSLTMKLKMFDEDEEINIDNILKIHPDQIYLEVCTIPVVLNKIGILLADAENAVNLAKIETEVLSAQLADAYRNEQVEKGEKAPSNEKVNEYVTKNANYILKKKIYLKRVKERDYVNSLYWSLKSKDQKLNQLMNTIEAADMSEAIINSRLKSFNYVDIQILKSKNN